MAEQDHRLQQTHNGESAECTAKGSPPHHRLQSPQLFRRSWHLGYVYSRVITVWPTVLTHLVYQTLPRHTETQGSAESSEDEVVASCPRHLLHKCLAFLLLHARQVRAGDQRQWYLSRSRGFLHREIGQRRLGSCFSRGQGQYV